MRVSMVFWQLISMENSGNIMSNDKKNSAKIGMLHNLLSRIIMMKVI